MLAPTAMAAATTALFPFAAAEKFLLKMTVSKALISFSALAMLLSVSCNSTDTLGSFTEERLDRSRKYAALKKAQKDKEEKKRVMDERRREMIASEPFRFTDLPAEICLLILEQCSIDCFIPLLQVSRTIQRFTYQACLPRLGISLVDSGKIASLKTWLDANPSLRPYLRHLWIEPWNDDDFDACVDILQQCTKVESIVCAAQMLEAAVGSSSDQLRHLSCRSLTLPNSSADILPSFAGTPAGSTFLSKITHLRIMGPTAPRGMHFPNLTHLSYSVDAVGDNVSHDQEMFPRLRKVILTRWRRSAGGVRISRARSDKAFMFELPMKWSEGTMWRDDVRGRGVWDL